MIILWLQTRVMLILSLHGKNEFFWRKCLLMFWFNSYFVYRSTTEGPPAQGCLFEIIFQMFQLSNRYIETLGRKFMYYKIILTLRIFYY